MEKTTTEDINEGWGTEFGFSLSGHLTPKYSVLEMSVDRKGKNRTDDGVEKGRPL